MTSSGLSRARHKVLRGHLPRCFGLDALNSRPGRTHSTATPFGHGYRMNAQPSRKLRAGEILACQEVA